MREKYKPGDRIGELTLIEKVIYKIPSGKTKSKWKCKCSCGKETYVFAANLNKTKSCGHLTKEGVSKARFCDLTGKTFGRLFVLRRVNDRINISGRRIVRYLCKCSCGNEVTVDANELRKGTTQSCGCLQKELNGASRCKIHVGDTFGKLTVIEKMPSFHYGRSTMSRWKCKCECGSITTIFGGALLRGQISCGCINSKAEEEIANILSSKQIKFGRQYYFDDLLSDKGFPVYFDFSIEDDNELLCLIEYQGIQHYIPQSNHFGDYQREVTDVLKREYCENNSIKLFEIKYDENISDAIDKILSIVYEDTVPSVDTLTKV